MKHTNKALSLLLTLAMLASLLPWSAMPAQAADTTEVTDESTEWSGVMVVPAGSSVVIDDIVSAADGTILSVGSNAKLTINGSLIIEDEDENPGILTVEGPGTLEINGIDGDYDDTAGSDAVGGSIVVNSGTVSITGGDGGDPVDFGEPGGDGGTGIVGSLTVNGGTVTVSGGAGGSGADGYDGGEGDNGGDGGEGGCGGCGINVGMVEFNGGSLTIAGGRGGYGGKGGAGGEGSYDEESGETVDAGEEGSPGNDGDDGFALSESFISTKFDDAVIGWSDIGGEGEEISVSRDEYVDSEALSFYRRLFFSVKSDSINTWGALQAALESGGIVQLDDDVTFSGSDKELVVPEEVEVTLDLAGHVINRGLDANSSESDNTVITVYGNLTISDTVSDKVHEPAITYVDPISSKTVAVNGGIITGGVCKGSGGGIRVMESGIFIMNGGTVCGNVAGNGSNTNVGGGGVYVSGDSSFTMNGGTICGNTSGNGGGVYLYGGDFSMSGTASVSGNTYRGQTGDGGGVYVGSGSVFTMSGGSVTNNLIYEAKKGGGVYVASGGELRLSGNVNISGNAELVSSTKQNSNLYLVKKSVSATPLTITDALAGKTSIGVNASMGGIFAVPAKDYTLRAEDGAKLESENGSYALLYSASGLYMIEAGKLFVGGADIVAAKEQQLSDGKSGTAKLTLDKNGDPVLTLSGFTYNGAGTVLDDNNRAAVVYSGFGDPKDATDKKPLTVVLSGSNSFTTTVSHGEDDKPTYSFLSYRDVTFTGDGSLVLTTVAEGEMDTCSYGSYGFGKVVVGSGAAVEISVSAAGSNGGTGLHASKELEVYGTLSCVCTGDTAAGDSLGVHSDKAITVKAGGSLSATGGNAKDNSIGVSAASITVETGGSFSAASGTVEEGGTSSAVNCSVKNADSGAGTDGSGAWTIVAASAAAHELDVGFTEVRFPVEIVTATLHANYEGAPSPDTVEWDAPSGLPAAPDADTFSRTDYVFSGWNSSPDGKGTPFSGSISESCDLYAQWKPSSFKVTFDGNGSNGGSMTEQGFSYDSAQELRANGFTRAFTVTYSNDGATTSDTAASKFSGWATSATGSVVYTDKQSITFTLEDGTALTLYAKWTDASLTLPTPTKTGYTLDGWYSDAALSTKVGNGGSSYTPGASVTLYAKWTPNTYSVAFDGNGKTSGSMSAQSFTYGTAKELSANAYTRVLNVTYSSDGATTSATATATFNGWATSAAGSVVYTDKQSVNSLTTESGATVTLYAKWTDASLTLPTPTKTGYTLDGWYSDAALSTKVGNGGSSYTPGASVTLYAKWTPNTYSVAFDGNGKTSGSMSAQSFTYDTAKELSANAYTRAFTVTYSSDGTTTSATATATFNGWATSAAGSVVYTDKQSVNNLTAESGATVTLYAKWTDASVTLPTPTKAGYGFGGWYSDAALSTKVGSGGDSYTPSASVTLYAKWVQSTYSVAFDGNGKTSGTMSAQSFVCGTEQALTENGFTRAFTVTYSSDGTTTSATATATFNGWATSAAGSVVYTDKQSVNNLTTESGATVTLYAKWTDASVTLPNPTKVGYNFAGWYSDAALSTKVGSGGESYTPSASVTLYAKWDKLSTSVKIDSLGSDGKTVNYTVTNAPAGALLIAASYDSSGRMLSVAVVELTISGSALSSVSLNAEGDEYVLMLVNSSYAPLCAAARMPLRG